MKQLPSGLQAHLDSGATTMCWCWKLTRNDGEVQGFTDHDRDIIFAGVTFAAATGFTGTDLKDSVGLNVDNIDIDGALSAASLREEDLSAGLYDNATVELYRVNWQTPAQRVLMRKGSIGEVKRSKQSFTAEIRGLAHHLQQPKGRLFQYGCDANLGDARCKVGLNTSTYTGSGTVLSLINPRSFTVSGLGSYSADWFSKGLIRWTSGPNINRQGEIKFHTRAEAGGTVQIELWHEMAAPIAIGHSFSITAGCDKQFVTCRNKFSNGINFRGFPHIPGNDFALSYPNRDDVKNDGGSLQ